MRTLSASLLAAQKQAAATPYFQVAVKNKMAGVVRYDWFRLYTGAETDYFHALAIPGDGSLIRLRITEPADSRKLYRQRVVDPGPASDFSPWTYTGQYNAVVVAAASLGAEVSIFWIKSDRSIYHLKSADYGASWDAPVLLDYTATTSINGLAAAYKLNGDIALFYADQSILYVKARVGGTWGAAIAWDKSTGNLSGVATVYSGDWDLLVAGQDSSSNYKLWSLVYGDGGDVAAGTWSSLKDLASAPTGGDFEYRQPFIDQPDTCRGFFVEKYTGAEAYNRPAWSHGVVGAKYTDNLWREPVPFDLSSEYGLAIAHHGDYCWLSSPGGVWRANLTEQSLDLTASVVSARHELGADSGVCAVGLGNESGQYASPGTDSLAVLDIGSQLEISPGYRTSSGNETSPGLAFSLEAYEHISAGGKASLMLYAEDGWHAIKCWRARHQFRWNKSTSEMTVKDLLAFVLARSGLKLETVSASATATGFYPDFTISPGDSGESIIRRLLSFVPDVLFMEGFKAYLVNPQSSDSAVYSYGAAHRIIQGQYRQKAQEINRVQGEGLDAGGSIILADSFAWDEINRLFDRLVQVADRNLDTVDRVKERGEAFLREAEINSAAGFILAPVNCGQQLYDVIAITDPRAGLAAAARRVLGITFDYRPAQAEYDIKLRLGTV